MPRRNTRLCGVVVEEEEEEEEENRQSWLKT